MPHTSKKFSFGSLILLCNTYCVCTVGSEATESAKTDSKLIYSASDFNADAVISCLQSPEIGLLFPGCSEMRVEIV